MNILIQRTFYINIFISNEQDFLPTKETNFLVLEDGGKGVKILSEGNSGEKCRETDYK